MREARIVLPQTVDATPLEHRLTDLFGGYTQTSGSGGWRDLVGLTSREPVNVYDIAMPDTCDSLEALAVIAGMLFATTDEHAIYFRLPGGEVAIPARANARALETAYAMARWRHGIAGGHQLPATSAI